LIFSAVGREHVVSAVRVYRGRCGHCFTHATFINGVGITEASITGAVVAIGVPYESALLSSVLLLLLQLSITLAGGLLYLARTDATPATLSSKTLQLDKT
jgi:positive regulator of sigma E activity